jgi:hypothetical protein
MIYAAAFCPRTELPYLSSGGDTTPIPSLPGTIANIPPPTPLLAGVPVRYSQSPALSYYPAVAIIAKIFGTYLLSSTFL